MKIILISLRKNDMKRSIYINISLYMHLLHIHSVYFLLCIFQNIFIIKYGICVSMR